MSSESRIVEVNYDEFAIIINALMNMRNNMKNEEKETDLVDKVIRKTIKSPFKKNSLFYRMKRADVREAR